MKRVSLIFGTRAEAIKLCPLVLAFKDHSEFDPHVCVTGQHFQMLVQVLDAFGIKPDVDLELMQPDQTLAGLTSGGITAIDGYLGEHRPDLVIVQGDTTTAFCGALAAFYRRIPIGHVEAGLRTWDKFAPFPEEVNRVMISRLADLHFAPTQWAFDNLVSEGVPRDRIYVTGNTVIDALQIALGKVKASPPCIPGLPPRLVNGDCDQQIVLITCHRRESIREGFESICRAIAALAARNENVAFVYPVHLNPNVREPVFRILDGQSNIYLIEPLDYLPFIALMDRAKLILTDSGGIQEEAPSLGKPILVMRDTTERPEGVAAGTVRLVGTDSSRIQEEVSRLLSGDAVLGPKAWQKNPYGDGLAAGRIVGICRQAANNWTASVPQSLPSVNRR